MAGSTAGHAVSVCNFYLKNITMWLLQQYIIALAINCFFRKNISNTCNLL